MQALKYNKLTSYNKLQVLRMEWEYDFTNPCILQQNVIFYSQTLWVITNVVHIQTFVSVFKIIHFSLLHIDILYVSTHLFMSLIDVYVGRKRTRLHSEDMVVEG